MKNKRKIRIIIFDSKRTVVEHLERVLEVDGTLLAPRDGKVPVPVGLNAVLWHIDPVGESHVSTLYRRRCDRERAPGACLVGEVRQEEVVGHDGLHTCRPATVLCNLSNLDASPTNTHFPISMPRGVAWRGVAVTFSQERPLS